MAQFVDCLIIGGGQAGLAMSQCLTALGIDNVVLERGRIAHRWTSARWPSLRLLTPGWMTRLPGGALANARDGFLAAPELARRLRGYATDHGLPVIENIDVLALEKLGEGFRAVTSRGAWIARRVVIATGACDRPRTARWGSQLSLRIHQIASTQYRTPDDLPEGGVLVVGASATGVQLASELAKAGRSTMIAAGSHVRSPRRYRGRDLFEWLDAIGMLSAAPPANRPAAELRSQPSMQLVGGEENQNIDLYELARMGVVVAGRAVAARGTAVVFEQDLIHNLALGEQRRRRMLAKIDSYVEQHCPEMKADEEAWRMPGLLAPEHGGIDLAARGISTVLWATGYRRDYSWLHLDACDADGELRQSGGVCDVPGLFALGLPFMRHRASTFIDGVGRDAEALAPIIAATLGADAGLRAA